MNINKKIRIATFQKACAFLKSIKKKETPINLIIANPINTIAACFISNSDVTAAIIVSRINIDNVIFNFFIFKIINKL